MNPEIQYGNGKKITAPFLGNNETDLYFFSTNPLPPKEEVASVVSDILAGKEVLIVNGQLRHNSYCSQSNHVVSATINEVINKLVDVKYEVAIYSNFNQTYKLNNRFTKVLDGQPIAIVLSPIIDYQTYPTHKHLNFPINLGKYFIPTSLCYTDSPDDLGNSEEERVFNAMLDITIWLFMHHFWETSYNLYGRGIWLWKEAPRTIKEYELIDILNPKKRCRCGSKNSYEDCCIKKDIYSNRMKNFTRLYNYSKTRYFIENIDVINNIRLLKFEEPEKKEREILKSISKL